jgi:hypothetical protein
LNPDHTATNGHLEVSRTDAARATEEGSDELLATAATIGVVGLP